MIYSSYQILILGKLSKLSSCMQSCIEKAFHDIQLSKDSYKIIRSKEFKINTLGVNPTVALYFTSENKTLDLEVLSQLKEKAVVIIPIVDSFDNAVILLPDCLKEINAACIADENDTVGQTEVTNLVLSNLGLLTRERNIFISYKRMDCQDLANQLYDKFLHAGYNVFLDTESLSAGVVFQESLRHRLADSFALVLLNSEHFFDTDSKWTLEEYMLAQNLKIGICSVLLPGVNIRRELNFSDFLRLESTDFTDDTNKYLKNSKIDEIVLYIKSIYARLYESRKQALVNSFTESLRKQRIVFVQQTDGTLFISTPKLSCKVIPLIGIPESWDYYVTDIKRHNNKDIPVYLLYNNQCILDEWLKHLAWLEEKSGVHSININDSLIWIQKNL